MAKYSVDILKFARLGAEQYYGQLKLEIEGLEKQFPHLRGLSDKLTAGTAFQMTHTGNSGEKSGSVRIVKRPKRKKMSAANRKAQSLRMKKYWAARRRSKNG